MPVPLIMTIAKLLDPRKIKQRLKQLAITLGVLGAIGVRAVLLAERAAGRRNRSHALRSAQAVERLRERTAEVVGEAENLGDSPTPALR